MNTEQLAWKIRFHGIEMTHRSKGSHIASILSLADIIAVLYNDVLRFNPQNPSDENRDRIILSKGHAGAAIYAALAEKGFFPVKELETHYMNGSRLSGHVSHEVPGVDFSTGSLGHGLAVGAGMALAAKKKKKNWRVFVVLGDGECDEGAIWEAALFCHHNKLTNLTVIIDHNKMQSLDDCEKTLQLEPFAEKWCAFGFRVMECDGHDCECLRETLSKSTDKEKPTCIIAHTIKGKGISFMEKNILWHYRSPQGEEYMAAMEELERIKP